jgi:putative component of toxin-antitoxin plasmid stabilization module
VPATEVLLFRDERGRAPVREWLDRLQETNPRAHARCVIRIERLAAAGYELRRPEADMLRDGIHELRAESGHVNYRVLYCFHGRNVAVLLHAFTKEGAIPDIELQRALDRRRLLQIDPMTHIQED